MFKGEVTPSLTVLETGFFSVTRSLVEAWAKLPSFMIRASGIQQTVSLEERSSIGTGGIVIITQQTGHFNRTASPQVSQNWARVRVPSQPHRREPAFYSDETKLVHSRAVPPDIEFRAQTLEPARPGSSLEHPPWSLGSHLPPVKWD